MPSYADKPSTCQGCPAYEKGRSFVPPSGPSTARVALVGQGPGREEAEGHWSTDLQVPVRAPFIGRSGRKLDQWLARVNASDHSLPSLRREECFLTNVVQCWLTQGGKDRAPTAREVAFCRKAHWQPQLEGLPNLQVVVPIGVPALRAFLGDDTDEFWAGGLYQWEPSK